MKKVKYILGAALIMLPVMSRAEGISSALTPSVLVNANAEPMAAGKFEPTWKSLKQYETPEWFRDAKFGIWAHWGAQCQPEAGDWYARNLYVEGSAQNKFHLTHYGHPSTNGFKDVIHEWKAQNWNPDKLLDLYKRAGAKYFFALANHHDNFDNWDSKYQPWNSVKLGPQQDLIRGWAMAARKNGMRFGVSVHAAHAWMWYEPAQGADKAGPRAGVSYDGKLTKANGKGQWWDGLDPQELYAQQHPLSTGNNMGKLWSWGNGASQPDAAYCDKFYNRTIDLINKYQPDLIYFDDNALPLWPVSDAGLKIAAHYYNSSMALHHGHNEAVLFGKILDAEQQQCMAWDIERGVSPTILPHPWQTDTCIGGWHYSRSIFDKNQYKSAKTVIHMLADIVSKNGNLLLSVPVRADGTIDEKEVAIVEAIASWMDVNQEAIFSTRPWKVFGEGPATDSAALSAQGFNEGKAKPTTAADFRFTTKGNVIYAIELGWPTNAIAIKSLGKSAGLLDRPIRKVELLTGGQDKSRQPVKHAATLLMQHDLPEKLQWHQTGEALLADVPKSKPSDIAIVFKITTQ